ncbi:hypothetical protein KBA41_07595, partial [Candidatus Ozemobacteraceae bacterium]|nr:hypothetical protein [Candidatus Ozemobacteraceae bacterium]
MPLSTSCTSTSAPPDRAAAAPKATSAAAADVAACIDQPKHPFPIPPKPLTEKDKRMSDVLTAILV